MPRKKTEMQKGEKLTFRLAPRYAEKVVEQSRAANVTPNQVCKNRNDACCSKRTAAIKQ